MHLTVSNYSRLATFTLLICALCGGFLFLTGSHIPKYIVLVFCFLTIIASYIIKKAPDIHSYTRSYIEFFTPWIPWYFSVIVLVLFFKGIPESSEYFNAFLIMFFIFGALSTQRFSRTHVITYLAIALILVSLAVDIQIGNYSDITDSEQYAWLLANAYKYGFVQTYTAQSQKENGKDPRPQHWRYVGLNAATTMHANNWTLKEYLNDRGL